jgi:thioredoxin 1
MIKKDSVTELGQREFLEAIKDKKNNFVIADFYAEWCMPCLMMAPVMENIAEKNKNVRFVKINVDDAQNLSVQYQITSIPCIIFLKDGKEVDRVIGAVDEARIEEKIRSLQNK